MLVCEELSRIFSNFRDNSFGLLGNQDLRGILPGLLEAGCCSVARCDLPSRAGRRPSRRRMKAVG